jgi:ribonuclease HI
MSGEVVVHTDGACKGNPGVGGWGVVLQYGGHTREFFGGEAHTTNNRMELTAVIRALQALNRPCRVRLCTDSRYVQQGITTWIHDWKKRGWKTAERKPVKNADLWRSLDEAAARHDVHWEWVRGHADNEGNVRADELANMGAASVEREEKGERGEA